MKKALLLSIVMLVGTVFYVDLSAAYATTIAITGGTSKDNAKSISFSNEYGILLTQSETQWFKFTTNNSDEYWYNITVKNINVDSPAYHGVSAYIYDDFDETFAYAGAFEGNSGTDGAKLEKNTTYYLAIWGWREGTIKFQLDAVFDRYGETKNQAADISYDKYYESRIDSPGGLSDNREEDNLSGDVDYVKFYTGDHTKIKLYLYNSDVDYYNTYFEGVAAIVTDFFGEQFGYLEVSPTSKGVVELELDKNTYYNIKFFATSGGVGNYKFKIEFVSLGKANRGDADGDGELTVRDATYIQLYLANLLSEDEIDLSVCDMDSDGKVNVKDVTYIQLQLANLI